jgi:hypothetical protein
MEEQLAASGEMRIPGSASRRQHNPGPADGSKRGVNPAAEEGRILKRTKELESHLVSRWLLTPSLAGAAKGHAQHAEREDRPPARHASA